MKSFGQIALIGPTASGKSALGVALAQKTGGVVLSLDSLAIYKEIDIASAKPTPQERSGIPHYGLDLITPNISFDVTMFAQVYQNVYAKCLKDDKPLIIVGGTSFYLKALLRGISERPKLSIAQRAYISEAMKKPRDVYEKLKRIDPVYMQNISPNDTYRIEKALEIHIAANKAPSAHFHAAKPSPVIKDPLTIYEIVWDREALRKRIEIRTAKMLKTGLIDEVFYLEQRYSRAPNPMKAIGIKETLAYLDGKYDQKGLFDKIVTNTARLAKRQRTFNRTQFLNVTRMEFEAMRKHFQV